MVLFLYDCVFVCLSYRKSLSHPKDIIYSQGFDSFKFWLFTFRYWFLWNLFLYVGWGRNLILMHSLRKSCCFITVPESFPHYPVMIPLSYQVSTCASAPHSVLHIYLSVCALCTLLQVTVNINAWGDKFSSPCSPKSSWFSMPFCSSN